MLRRMWLILAGLGLMVGLALNAGPALAGDNFHFSLGLGLPAVAYPAPVVVAPAPVYVGPPAWGWGHGQAHRHWRRDHRWPHRGYVYPAPAWPSAPGHGRPRYWR